MLVLQTSASILGKEWLHVHHSGYSFCQRTDAGCSAGRGSRRKSQQFTTSKHLCTLGTLQHLLAALALVQGIHPNSCAFLSSFLNSSTHLQYCSGNMTGIESSPTHFMYPWKLHDMKPVEETSLCGMAHNLKYIKLPLFIIWAMQIP